MPGTATKGSVQQRVHRMSVGHDERLVVIGSVFFFVSLYVRFLLHCLLAVRWGRQALLQVLALALACATCKCA